MDDALKAMTKRQMEELRERLDKELQSCSICGSEGAEAYTVSKSTRGETKTHIKASLLLCKPCFERIRLPESRAISPPEGVEGNA